MAPHDNGTLILLAAGRGTRFGSDKRQHPMATGSSLLATTLRLYQGFYSRVVVVLRPGDEALGQQLIQPMPGLVPAQLVYAQHAAQGMGHSLASGANALLNASEQPSPAATAARVTVALADMPYVQLATLAQLQQRCANLTAPFIVQPSYQGQPGNPVVFSADYLAAFTQLEGDQGARAIVRSQPKALHLVAVEDPGVVQDIDQPRDIQR